MVSTYLKHTLSYYTTIKVQLIYQLIQLAPVSQFFCYIKFLASALFYHEKRFITAAFYFSTIYINLYYADSLNFLIITIQKCIKNTQKENHFLFLHFFSHQSSTLYIIYSFSSFFFLHVCMYVCLCVLVVESFSFCARPSCWSCFHIWLAICCYNWVCSMIDSIFIYPI